MQLTFLEAAVPLTKTYKKLPDGSYQGSSYPNVEKVTSHTADISTISEFRDSLYEQAATGRCLYAGTLERPLENESRAKLTKDTDREWIMLDLDGVEGFNSVEEFIHKVLPVAFHNCSYILQHSPSSGIKSGLRVHIFFLLYMPVSPKLVKAWLQNTNLDTGPLSDRVTLSKNARGLRYPLDIVVNDNARIIYITPPECVGFSDPVAQRIHIEEKQHEQLIFNFASLSTPQLQQKFRSKVEDLRIAQGLPKTAANAKVYRYDGDHEYVEDKYVEQTRITAYQADNDQFMRCNLDGGDSFAYYYFRNQKNPYLHNFKGEPSVHISVIDPDFYKSVVLPDYKAFAERNDRPFVFRDIITDKYYQGIRRGDRILEQPHIVGSSDKIDDFFADRGNTSPPDPIVSWTREFDPTQETQWLPEERMFNFWRPTKYMEDAMYRSNPPETIEFLIRHVTGGDDESYEYFINWLAYIFQTRKKTGTAWILHGVPGTGKGVLYNYVIRPIFGQDYCETKQIRDLRASFNGWMEHALFVNIDETNAEDAGREESAVIEALKMWITDPILSIEAKHQNARMAKNFSNFIFTSNDHGALPIQEGDRRYNVAPRQERPITMAASQMAAIRGELEHFSGFLSGVSVDSALATRPLENAAKKQLRKASRSSIDEFVHALMDGDLEYFARGVNEVTKEFQEKENFKQALDKWIQDAKGGRPSEVTLDDLKAAYIVMCSGKPMLTTRFGKMMGKRGYPPQILSSQENGWKTTWELSAQAAKNLKIHLKSIPSSEDLERKVQTELSTTSPKDAGV